MKRWNYAACICYGDGEQSLMFMYTRRCSRKYVFFPPQIFIFILFYIYWAHFLKKKRRFRLIAIGFVTDATLGSLHALCNISARLLKCRANVPEEYSTIRGCTLQTQAHLCRGLLVCMASSKIMTQNRLAVGVIGTVGYCVISAF